MKWNQKCTDKYLDKDVFDYRKMVAREGQVKRELDYDGWLEIVFVAVIYTYTHIYMYICI